MEYAELTCKSNYSFLRGASFPEELVARAVELGLSGLALTDKDGVYGLPRAWVEARDHPAFKFICGAELTLAGRPPLAFLCRDRAAYGLLCRMITASFEGREKGEALLGWERFLALASEKAAQGLVALCAAVEGADHGALNELFPGRLYVPLCRPLDGRDRQRTRRALQTARRFGLPLLACNDVHYHEPSRRKLQDILTSIREGAPLPAAGTKVFSNGERHLKSPAQMARLFSDLPEAVSRTAELAASCAFTLSEIRYQYPSEWIPKGLEKNAYLRQLVDHGARGRFPGGVPSNVRRQLDTELELIARLGYADYFLTIWEIVQFANSRNILNQGRGSAANSAVCYCLGITAIDPVRMSLLFERFISEERREPPDIDVDFENARREEVIQHLYEKYGRDRAAMVAAVVTFRTRSAIREVSKALGVALDVRPDPDSRAFLAKDEKIQALAAQLKGFPRHLSIHSGGFVLSGEPLVESVPVEPGRMPGRTIIQWDKNDLDSVGLLKIDLLALGMLTALHKAFDLVNMDDNVGARRAVPLHGPGSISLATIPPEDPATYAMMRAADTLGVFQIESRAQINMLGRLKPLNFYDLVVEVALVRPGPSVGGMVRPYLRRRQGREAWKCPDPRLQPILGRTLGVALFQEQVMKLAVSLAGFTPGQADQLRRAIAAWRVREPVHCLAQKLFDGLLASGLPRAFACEIFHQIRGFAEYGFPESHAASFALLVYASAWLKRHHPAEFLCGLLNSQPMGFYSPHSLVDDARRHGVKVLPVHPSLSGWDCLMEGGAVRLGFREVRGLGEEKGRAVADQARQRPFADLGDFCRRSGLEMRVMEKLALGGAFECFGLKRRQALWEVLAWDLLARPGEASGQLGLDLRPRAEEGAENFKPMDLWAAVGRDFAGFGLSLNGHPMQALRLRLAGLPPCRAAQANRLETGHRLEVAGLVIVRQRPGTAKGVTFAALEDETGFLDLTIKPEVYRRFLETFSEQNFIGVGGKIYHDGDSTSLLVDKAWPLFDGDGLAKVSSRDWH